MSWTVVYERAIREDGSLLFPERLSHLKLEEFRRTMGSYNYANQFLNQCIPDDEKSFKPQWLRYYSTIPTNTYRFAFIDPAIGQKNHHDYTGICVIDVDSEGTWYLRLAARYRLTPTEIIEKIFQVQKQFSCMGIGIEIVAYQEALLYMLDEEMRKRNLVLPVKGINRRSISKQSRILGLVPKFEWGRLFVAQGMTDFEDEYGSFPRGSHDDILDALASLDELVYTPEKEKPKPLEKPANHLDPTFESWVIQNMSKRQKESSDD